MTARSHPLSSVAAFEQAIGVEVRASTLAASVAGPLTVLQFSVAAKHACTSALALIYDLSDSCGATPRLAARIPELLRGWPRDIALWAYALSDDKPLTAI